ncbi:sulfur carrier protein ThiS [bacterium A37T11]|nr:sulfur carrier protein ThiS [bacterium A37T11]
MEVTINQQLFTTTQDHSLLGVLVAYGLQPGKGIAVAVNQSVVPKTEWDSYVLKEKDQLIIIKAAQGG